LVVPAPASGAADGCPNFLDENRVGPLQQRRKRCPPLLQTRIVDSFTVRPVTAASHSRRPNRCTAAAQKGGIEYLNGAVIYVSLAASISASRPAS